MALVAAGADEVEGETPETAFLLTEAGAEAPGVVLELAAIGCVGARGGDATEGAKLG